MYICQICKKVPATIHLTDIHNNVKKEVHICEACAAEKGFNLHGAANLPQLLGLAAKKAASVGQPQAGAIKTKIPTDDLICLKCGTTWSQFSDRGRLGCPHDYHAFDAKIRPLIANQIAPHTSLDGPFHVGKKPGPRAEMDEVEENIRALEKRLRRAVAEENYESAARMKEELDALREKRAKG